MPLLDWLEEEEEFLVGIPQVYLVPVTKKVWGTFRVAAVNEEEARQAFYDRTYEHLEENIDWHDDPQYDYESCGVIEREV